MRETLVFVYGTLMKGLAAHGILEKEGAEAVGIGEIKARLYNLGNFPAALPSEEEGRVVKGELYRVSQELLDDLDGYEGIARGMYRREQVEVAVDSWPAGHNIFTAWVYFFDQKLPEQAQAIPDGDYRKSLVPRGFRNIERRNRFAREHPDLMPEED